MWNLSPSSIKTPLHFIIIIIFRFRGLHGGKKISKSHESLVHIFSLGGCSRRDLLLGESKDQMNVIWFPSSILILSLGVVSGYSNSNGHSVRNTSARPGVVNIGAIVSFDSTIGRAAQLAIQEAVEDVNSDPTVLRGTNLSVVMRNSDCSGFFSMLEAMQIMEGDVVAIIGPQSSVVAHYMSYMVSELRVPMLSFAATDPTLSPLQFPYFVRTAHSDLYQMTAVAKIVEYYVWREVTAVFVDDDYGRNGVAALGDALAERRCKVSYKAVIPPGPTVSRDDIVDILGKVMMSESRVIVVHVDPGIGLKVFDAAKSLGMMGKGYVWIATDGLSSVLDSWYHSPADTMGLLQGVLLLRQHSPESHRKRDFYSRWKKLTGGSFGFNSYGLCAYDAVWLIARALDVYFDEGGVISFSNDSMIGSVKGGDHLHLEAPRISDGDGGRLLLKSVLQSNFVGLSGPLKFNADRSRILPAYDIINVVGTGIRRTGYWSNYSGLSIVPPETLYQSPNHSTTNQHLRSVIWPGETIVKPRGWVFPNNGKILKIGVPNRVSYREFVEQVQGVDSSQAFRGFCIDVFRAAVNLLPYTVPYKFVPFGDGHKNPSYTELVNKIAMGFFDAGVGDIAIVANRTKIVDFTQPYTASGLVVVALFRESGPGAWAFMQPFSLPLWGATVSSFAVVGLVVWILEHRSNEAFRGAPKRQLATVIWFSLSTLFFAHKQNTVSTLGRLVLLIWLFVVLIINSNYTANLTSILAVQRLSSPIKGIESLIENDEPIGFQVGSFAELYLEKLGISKSRLVPLGSPDEYATKLQLGPKNGGVAAVVDDSAYAELFLSRHCDCRIVGEEFTKSSWGFAFPRDSHLAADLSAAIVALSESGDLQRIRDEWLKTSGCSSDEAEIQSATLRLRSFGGLFLACGIACLIAILIHSFQIVRQFRRVTASAEYPSAGEPHSHPHRRLQTLLSILDEKQADEASGSRKRPKVDQPSPMHYYYYGEQDEIREDSDGY